MSRIWSRPEYQCSRRRASRNRAFCSYWTPISGATDIARKPNYDFERRERDRSKAAEAAKKAQAKADRRAGEQAAPTTDEPGDPQDP